LLIHAAPLQRLRKIKRGDEKQCALDCVTENGHSAILAGGEADAHFGASVFWARRCSVFGGEQSMIEYWQTRREGGQRGIVEIISE
jgi:hypothetical protein